MSSKNDEYAQIVANEPLLSQTALQERTRNISVDEDEDVVVFYSSGDEPKHIPYSEHDQRQAVEAMGETFSTAGLDEDDVVLNLGAPAETHHQSGWGIKHGSEAAGATVINDSVKDATVEEVKKQWDDVTTVMSLPRMLHSIGETVEQSEEESLHDLFPNVEKAITSGDTLPQSLRNTVKEQWDADMIRSFYSGTEMGAVAAEDGNGGMVPTNDTLYIELLDPDADVDTETHRAPEEAITPIYDVDEPVTGAALFSAPDRDLLPFIRYRAGDMLTAYPSDTGARLTFEGREDRVINLSGAMVYPREIENAVQSYSDTADWNAVVSVEDDYPVLDLFISEAADDEDIVPYLADENGSIEAWYDSGAIKIRQHSYTSNDELEAQLAQYDLDVDLLADQRKLQRVAFDASYTA